MDHTVVDEGAEMAIIFPSGVYYSCSFSDVSPCTHVIGFQPADDLLLRRCAEHVYHSHAQGHLLEHVSDPKDCEFIL